MRKKAAREVLEALYESTYTDAVAQYCTAFGTLNHIEDAFTKIYLEVYKHLLRLKKSTSEQTKDYFDKVFCEYISANSDDEQNQNPPDENSKFNTTDITKVLSTEFDISEKEFFESMLNKKIYSYVMTKPIFVRKVFLLFFYCGYTIERISVTLNCKHEIVTSSIYTLLTEIQNSFLKNKITEIQGN